MGPRSEPPVSPVGGTLATPVPDAGTRPLLRIEDLVKRFGGVAAVDGVSFDLHCGEILGLIGPNGAGKTTLFDCIAGTQRPSAGHIVLGAQRIERMPPHRRLAAGLGRTFQIPRPFSEMTLLENMLLGRQGASGERILPNWLSSAQVAREEAAARSKALELLDFLTLARLSEQPARVLSGGQRKLLELARVLMAEPSVVLLDEPAAGVNPSLLETVIDRIAALNRQGTTFLLIEHNMDLVSRLCGRVLVMASGRVLMEGTPAEVTADPRVIEAYLGGVAA